jgi:hypothetical protein
MELSSIFEFIDGFVKGGYMRTIAGDPRVQFGTARRPLMLARWLPVVRTDTNTLVDEILRFGEIIADDGSPLSPPQIKRPPAAGIPLTTRLGHIDIATQMTGEDMKKLGNLLNRNDKAAAQGFVARWLTTNVRLAIESKAELQRAQAIADAQVSVVNKDGDTLLIQMPNPTGHRLTVPSGTVAAPTGWYAPDYDPFVESILPLKRFLAAKGFQVIAILYSSRIEGALLSNQMVIRRTGAGGIVVAADGQIQPITGSVTEAGLANLFRAHGLPAPTIYDRFYSSQIGSYRYMDDSKMVFICSTGADQEIEYMTEQGMKRELLGDVLGYYGEGISDGQVTSGTVITLVTSTVKPVGVYSEGYREGFPVVKHPEAIATLTIPVPTP